MLVEYWMLLSIENDWDNGKIFELIVEIDSFLKLFDLISSEIIGKLSILFILDSMLKISDEIFWIELSLEI